jgi:hypothetical protein
VTGTVAAGALVVGSALGFGLGTLTPSGTAAARPVGLGFLPERGWTVLATGREPTLVRPSFAIVANVPLHRDEVDGLPYETLLALPQRGAVIFATFTPQEDAAEPDSRFPARQLPLRLRDADPYIEYGTQVRPDRPLGQYQLRGVVNGYAVDLQIYFGSRRPAQSLLEATQRQLDRLVVERSRQEARVGRRATPLAPSSTTAGTAAKVIDRTLACQTGYRGGARLLLATARAQGVTQQQQNLAAAYVTTPANPVPTSQNFEPTLAGVTAGSRRPTTGTGGLGFDAKLCKPTRAAVAFSPRGLSGGYAPSYGLEAQCFPGKTVLVRVRARFGRPVTLKLVGRGATYQAIGRVEKGEIMVRTTAGRPLVYADVADNGRARLYSARGCF